MLRSGTTTSKPDGADDPWQREAQILGQKIRSARTAAGLTLDVVAQKAGVSRSLVSQIERGSSQPSINSLRSIAAALSVPVASFFIDPPPQPSEDTDRYGQRVVVRQSARTGLHLADSKVYYQLLVPDLHRNLEVLWGEVPPGALTPTDGMSIHAGEEVVLVVSGTLLFELESDQFTLETGDSIAFDATRPHRLANPSGAPTHIVVAITPPSF